ncbi:transcriptional regulator, LysR family [Cribrihabitans marinus]|uniref:Transcriptional regulator, LysR family n=1 Tax=Cribrihabitans marinus TaxID=1227549 RepID=A0A1H6ZYI2_9RHOB|nr:LysR family transcriptional regulator [Cribrihabitans marinus]GGH29751.1 LysR family transcriptional regulator [Cribrihabitans marinus]SEJ58411.1 transcriptional regulator, LysR family [Cribrihabitans marinus]
MIRNLDITTLRSFLAVAEQGGVTRAAAVLNLTQSAVSMQLKRLEEVLGIALLDRSNRRIGLTGAGEQLLSYARRIVALNDEVVGRLTDDVYEGELILGVPHDLIYPVIPQVLQQFNRAFPRVKIQLLSSFTTRLHEIFERGEADAILTTEAELRPGGQTLAEVPLRWYGAAGGSAWKQRPLRLAYSRNCAFRPQVIRHLEEAGLDWEMAVDSDSDRSVEAVVSADLAVFALLEGHAVPGSEPLPAGHGLPDLNVQKINLHVRDGSGDDVLGELVAMLQAGFCRFGAPRLASAPAAG